MSMPSVTTRQPRAPGHGRSRGAVLAAMVLLLAVINLAVVTVATSGAESMERQALLLQGLRAKHAADSAAIIAMQQFAHAVDPSTIPGDVAGSTLLTITGEDASAAMAVLSMPTNTQGGTLEVRGRSGGAQRHIRIEFSVR